jgi:hypothetical protein
MAKPHPMPCATKLRLLLAYDPITGALMWRRSARRGYKPGDLAGCVHRGTRHDYRIVRIEGKGYYAHRLIWKIVTGQEPIEVIDHADSDTLNNVWENLRDATECQNGHNRRLNKNNTTGVKGVHPEGSKFRAIIKKDKRLFDLGRFSSVDAAKAEIDKFRMKLHGEFARVA